MGIVKGVTKFLPISSPGHVIIIGGLLHFAAVIASIFDIFVHSGVLIALILYFARDQITPLPQVREESSARRLLLAASGYDFLHSLNTVTASAMPAFAVGAIASFRVALLVIHYFLSYVSSHTLRLFAWYRLLVGAVMLVVYAHVLSV